MKVIVKHLAGSTAYGTQLPTSDRDVRGVFYDGRDLQDSPQVRLRGRKMDADLPLEHVLEDEEDGKLFEMSHFIEMYSHMNPNILETLWVDREHILETSNTYEFLRSRRELFLTREAGDTFGAYAHQQIIRIKGHNKHINNPMPEEVPSIYDFFSTVRNYGGPELDKVAIRDFARDHILDSIGGDVYTLIPGGDGMFTEEDKIRNYRMKTNAQIKATPPLAIIKFDNKAYSKALGAHKKYWEWYHGRNKVRRELEEKYGYDTKHGMHVVRLLRMGLEITQGKGVIVNRPDAEELLAIRAGAWKYQDLLDYAQHLQNQIWGAMEGSELPEKSDPEFIIGVLLEARSIAEREFS